jgi:hypothetical protein
MMKPPRSKGLIMGLRETDRRRRQHEFLTGNAEQQLAHRVERQIARRGEPAVHHFRRTVDAAGEFGFGETRVLGLKKTLKQDPAHSVAQTLTEIGAFSSLDISRVVESETKLF